MTVVSRVSKQEYYLNIAKAVAERGTCLRKNYGAIIVKDDVIIATGYTGAPRGCKSCLDLSSCRRESFGGTKGTYDLCCSVHAEMNCIINAPRAQMLGSTMYLSAIDKRTGEEPSNIFPCITCQSLIINAGIEYIITANCSYPSGYFRSYSVDSLLCEFERRGSDA